MIELLEEYIQPLTEDGGASWKITTRVRQKGIGLFREIGSGNVNDCVIILPRSSSCLVGVLSVTVRRGLAHLAVFPLSQVVPVLWADEEQCRMEEDRSGFFFLLEDRSGC